MTAEAPPPRFAQVAVEVPLHTVFTYAIPQPLVGRIQPGQLVHVPWRQHSRTAIVMGLSPDPPADLNPASIKDLEDILDPEPLLDAQLRDLVSFIASYYRAPIGEVAMMAVPNAFRRHGTRMFTLTLAGRDAVDAMAKGHLKTALELLAKAEKSTIPGPDLVDWVRGLTYVRLDEAVEDGLLETDYLLERPKISISTETWVRIVRVPRRGTRMGRVQAQIMEILKREGEVPLKVLEDHVGKGARASSKSLVEKRWVELEEREVIRDPHAEEAIPEPTDHELSAEQSAALDAISSTPEPGSDDGYRPFLLHGVTGSGKTEVYIRTIRALRADGASALVLLPEIALTPQFCNIFRSHFGDDVAVLHSGLTPGERYDAWRRLRSGDVGIAIGARSALFAPMPRLGVIIVDEEHETSFKQEENPRYNARDMALVRGSLARCAVILGSATPSLESIHLTHTGRVTYLPMRKRAADRPLPAVEIVDMTAAPGNEDSHVKGRKRSRGKGIARARREANETDQDLIDRTFSLPLIESIEDTLARGQQVIILLNRRGHSTFVQCTFCGKALYCPNCTVSLTYHQRPGLLRCHYCDFARPLPARCSGCGRPELGLLGIGTEKLTLLLRELFAYATVERLDRDTGGGKRLRRLMQRFRDGNIDVLVGTQMVAKGHDVHNVTLVGVVMADLTLNFPDFRASERTFQLLTQVAGRAGRGEQSGRVIIQSLTPDHYALLSAQKHDFERFSKEELEIRKERRYPPFVFLIAIKFEATKADLAERCAVRFAQTARSFIDQHARDPKATPIVVLGPTAAPLGKIRGRSRFQMLLKCDERKPMRLIVERTHHALTDELRKIYRSVRVIVDVDPMNML